MKTELDIDGKLMEQARRLAPDASVENIVAQALRYWVSKRSAEELRKLRGQLHWDEDREAMRQLIRE